MTQYLVRTCCENLDQQIIDKSADEWRYRLKDVVVRVNSCSDSYPVHFAALLCCVAYAFYEHACVSPMCIERYCGTVTKKVNLANNHLTFQDEMGVILC